MILILILAALVVWAIAEASGESVQQEVDDWASKMAAQMAKFENSNPDYNNPLALQGTGDTGTTAPNGLGIFSSAEAGLEAGINLLKSYAARFPDLSITQALARWQTGKSDIDQLSDADRQSVNNEAGMVGSALGVDPDGTTLGDLSGSDDGGDP
jgi:hypothetical protein